MNDYNSLTYAQLIQIADCIIQGEPITSPQRGIDNFVFTYFGKVVAKERARGEHFYTPKATRDFEADVKDKAYRYMRTEGYHQTFAFPMQARIEIHTEMPEDWPQWKKTLAVNNMLLPTKQDTDNKVKAIQDGMNKVVYRDDKQIFDIRARQVYRRADMFTFKFEPIGLTKLEVDRLAKIMKAKGA